ncbi:hypothetical protein [Pseudaestuariivita atlantica]|uniref:Uncharacterized protein n=1 Tax=Pseudaestuariivita atlantica TaxID=1317121 RepID=A0A0L1JNU0_9RHOB|nr:hypothetical protein [Pseudaestuariivita atlantica]KNG93063.1 hypothetical protein ATO11_14185 [Pseudaestuariivita atlantica]
MITDRSQLLTYFRNGQLPTEDHFEALITSLTHASELDALRQEMTSLHDMRELKFGSGDADNAGDPNARWTLFPDAGGTLRIARGGPAEDGDEPQSPADVQIRGWAGSEGRLGNLRDPDAFIAPDAELDRERLMSVKMDGTWKTILNVPRRPCAVEVMAATERPAAAPRSGIVRFLRWVVGLPRVGNTLTHVTAVSTGAVDDPPHIGAAIVTPGDRARAAAWRYAIVFGGLALSQSMSWLNGLWVGTAPAATILVLLLFFRSLLRWRTFTRNSVAVAWRQSEGTGRMTNNRTWSLAIRGPQPSEGAPGKIHYHVTKLWG